MLKTNWSTLESTNKESFTVWKVISDRLRSKLTWIWLQNFQRCLNCTTEERKGKRERYLGKIRGRWEWCYLHGLAHVSGDHMAASLRIAASHKRQTGVYEMPLNRVDVLVTRPSTLAKWTPDVTAGRHHRRRTDDAGVEWNWCRVGGNSNAVRSLMVNLCWCWSTGDWSMGPCGWFECFGWLVSLVSLVSLRFCRRILTSAVFCDACWPNLKWKPPEEPKWLRSTPTWSTGTVESDLQKNQPHVSNDSGTMFPSLHRGSILLQSWKSPCRYSHQLHDTIWSEFIFDFWAIDRETIKMLLS